MHSSEGQGRVTLFASSSNARTFNYEVRLVSPARPLGIADPLSRRETSASFRHPLDTTSRTRATPRSASSRSSTRTASRTSVSVRCVARGFTNRRTYPLTSTVCRVQWLALTPPALVKAHLDLDDETIANLSKTKLTVVGPA